MIFMFEYAAKFICGKSPGKIAAPGTYFTTINVHNPAYFGVVFKKKFAVALPEEHAGPVSRFFEAKLGPDQALEIDCPDIVAHSGSKADLITGFVVIQSETELDVVAVYTAAGSDGQVETMDIERVPARRIRLELPDLVPVPDEKGSFCKKDKQGNLIVTVRNQGSGSAGPSTTEVDFNKFGKVAVPTPGLAPGASVDLLVTMPPGCYNPDCEFEIVVDANNQVVESNKANNMATGICLG